MSRCDFTDSGECAAKADGACICADPGYRVVTNKSWYCHKCCVEVYQARCPHCGKTRRERS